MSDPFGNAPYMVVDGPRNQECERTYILVDLGTNKTAPMPTKAPTPKNKNIESYKVDFANQAWYEAVNLSSTTKIPAEIIFAQACIESSYGKHNNFIKGNNAFNIKGTGPAGYVIMKNAIEWDKSGNAYYENAKFKAYNSVSESYQDFGNLINSRYRNYISGNSLQDWADAMYTGGYATYAGYSSLIMDTIGFWGLK